MSLEGALLVSLQFGFIASPLLGQPFTSSAELNSSCLRIADRDDRGFGRDRDRNRDTERFETDWRARPTTDSFDDYPPRRGDDSFGGDSELIENLPFSTLLSSIIKQPVKCFPWGCSGFTSFCRPTDFLTTCWIWLFWLQ